MIQASEIERMTPTERLQAMELLWKAISTSPSKVESPKWHGEVLKSRLSKIKKGKAVFYTVDEIKSRQRARSK